jgi:hypothetical protein
MKKSEARALLGGSDVSAAQEMKITRSAFAQWPEDLPDRLADRVQAALARKHLDLPGLIEQATATEPPRAAA